jgi:hypothetical protein
VTVSVSEGTCAVYKPEFKKKKKFDVLLEHWPLQCKIRLGIEKVAIAAPSLSLRMLRANTLDKEPALRPKAMLVDNMFHTFEPPQIMGMVVWKIEQLWPSCQRVDAIAHIRPI